MTTPGLIDLHVSSPTHQTQHNRNSNITYLSGSGGDTEKKYASEKLAGIILDKRSAGKKNKQKKHDVFG